MAAPALAVQRAPGGPGFSAVPHDEVDTSLWAAVDRLVDRAPRLSDLRAHGLLPLAARRRRALSRPLAPELVAAERASALLTLVAPLLLERVRDAYSGPLLLMKGPEVARFYPDPALRLFRDLDLLVPDAEEAQRALLEAGFEPTGVPEIYVDIHHLRPLHWPGLPLIVEVHDRPKWVEWVSAPTSDELFAVATPGALGVDNVLVLPPAHHALLVAAHSWAHVPLSRLVHLVDVAAVSAGLDRAELEDMARRWGIGRVWRTTIRAADALLADRRSPWPLRMWARNLSAARERTVLETHLERWLGPFSAQPPAAGARRAAVSLGRALRPARGEPWRVKLARTRRAFRDAFTRLSDHQAALGRKPKLDEGRGRSE